MFPEEVIIDIPEFQIYNHSMSNIFAKDQKEHLNLKKMVKAVKQDSVIFQSLAEPLANGDLTVPTSIFDTFNILTIVSLCLSICSFLGIVYIVYKFRALSAALLLTKATSVKSSTVPVFRYVRPDNTLQDDATSTNISDILSWDHVSLLLVSISTLFIVIIVIKYFRKHRHNCKIVLEVTTGPLCTMIPITFLSLCPSYWEITPPSDIENIQISGFFRPMLTLEWDNFAIKNKLSEKQIEVKSTISLTYWQAYKLRKILNQPFCAYLILITITTHYQTDIISFDFDHGSLQFCLQKHLLVYMLTPPPRFLCVFLLFFMSTSMQRTDVGDLVVTADSNTQKTPIQVYHTDLTSDNPRTQLFIPLSQ